MAVKKKAVVKGKVVKKIVKKTAPADLKSGLEKAMEEFMVEEPCEACQTIKVELIGSLQASVKRMGEIAAEGKGHEHEVQNNIEYNRYFGAAIAANTLLVEYFGFKSVIEEKEK